MFPDIEEIESQLADIERDARALVSGLEAEGGNWRAKPGTWTVAECLDHLAVTNRVYLLSMQESALIAAEQGRTRQGPAIPGFAGRWVVKSLEPPAKVRTKAPACVQPQTAPLLTDALASFVASHDEVRVFLRENAKLDLATIRFTNPFIKRIRFSVATGLHIVAAHGRRHLHQAWVVRRAFDKESTL